MHDAKIAAYNAILQCGHFEKHNITTWRKESEDFERYMNLVDRLRRSTRYILVMTFLVECAFFISRILFFVNEIAIHNVSYR